MKKVMPTFLTLGIVILVLFSAAGGALADRLFVMRPLDFIFPRSSGPLSKLVFPANIDSKSDESTVVDVADTSSQSVITISVTTQRQGQSIFSLDPFGAFSAPGPSQIRPEDVKKDIGTGFVVDKAGLIVTNKHVVGDGNVKYKIITNDDKEYDVLKIYRDPTNDIAILKVDASLDPLPLGDSSTIKVGQSVIAIGTALGQFRHTVTTGVISGLGRGIDAGDGMSGFAERLDNVIQTDAAINPGNSGGPLLNRRGEVVGINVATAQSAQSIGFAIPVNVLKETLLTFNSTGQFNRPFFGVRYRLIPRETALLNDVPEGAYVATVVPNSSAAEADIVQGDIITKFDGKLLKEYKGGLASLVAQKKIGEIVEIEVWRNKEIKTIEVKLKEAKE